MVQESKKQTVTIRGTIERYDHKNKLVEILCDPTFPIIDQLEIDTASLPVRVQNALMHFKIKTYGDSLQY